MLMSDTDQWHLVAEEELFKKPESDPHLVSSNANHTELSLCEPFLICSLASHEVRVCETHGGVNQLHGSTVGPDFEPHGAQRWQCEARKGCGGRQTADTNVYTASEAIIIQPINADLAYPLPPGCPCPPEHSAAHPKQSCH